MCPKSCWSAAVRSGDTSSVTVGSWSSWISTDLSSKCSRMQEINENSKKYLGSINKLDFHFGSMSFVASKGCWFRSTIEGWPRMFFIQCASGEWGQSGVKDLALGVVILWYPCVAAYVGWGGEFGGTGGKESIQ